MIGKLLNVFDGVASLPIMFKIQVVIILLCFLLLTRFFMPTENGNDR
jgi:hypothetical protein